MNTPLQLTTARAVAWAFRFKQLQLARKAFRSVEIHVVLSRPFFGYDLFLNVSRSDAHRLLYLEGERFVLEQPLLEDLITEGDSVIDVGANIGYYALMFEKFVGPNGKLFCFEPEPDNYCELLQNIHHNHLENVTLFKAAVGDRDGMTHLACGLNGMVCPDSEEAIEVDLVSLDSVIDEKIDLVKIDVEGYEGHVLDGAVSLISNFHPSLFVEVHPSLLVEPYTTADIVNFAKERYDDIRFYDTQFDSLLDKVSSRYRSKRRVSEIKDESMVSGRREVFWMVCTSSKA